jgi:hypothetical protein
MGERIFAQTVGDVEAAVLTNAAMINNNTLMAMLKTMAQWMPRTAVTGGYVLLLGMVTVITEAVSAHAALIGYVFDPVAAYGALATDIATETGSADLASAAIGDMFVADNDATAVVKYANGTALAPFGAVNPGGLVLSPGGGIDVFGAVNPGGLVLSPGGGIDVTISTSNPTSGIGDVIVFYQPLTPNAYILVN